MAANSALVLAFILFILSFGVFFLVDWGFGTVLVPGNDGLEKLKWSAWRDKHPYPKDAPSFEVEVTRTARSSTSIIEIGSILSSRANPHCDLVLTMMGGRVTLKAGNKDFKIEDGSSVMIPAGTEYTIWNRYRNKSLFVAVYSPPLEAAAEAKRGH